MVDYSQQTSIQQLPAWLEDLSKKNMAYAQGVSENAITLPGQQIAGLGGMTQQALNTAQGIGGYMPMLNQAGGTTTQGINALTQGMQGVGSGFTGGMGAMQNAISGLQGAPTGQGYVGQAAGAYGQAGGQYGAAGFDPSSVSKYMNPYEDMAVQQALKDIRREGDVAQTAQQAAGVQAGAFGGSRQGLQSAELAGNIFKEQGRTAAGMRQAGFQNAITIGIRTGETTSVGHGPRSCRTWRATVKHGCSKSPSIGSTRNRLCWYKRSASSRSFKSRSNIGSTWWPTGQHCGYGSKHDWPTGTAAIAIWCSTATTSPETNGRQLPEPDETII